jgi:hypothetical protein
MKRANRVCWIFLAAALSASAQSNLLSNPGFETGYDGQRMMDAISAWPPETYPVWDWGRIRSAGTTATHSGTNTFQLDAYANYNKVMAQRWPAQTSRVYEVTGWLKSPAGAGYFQPTNGFCYVKIDFLNAAGAALGGQDSWARFGVSGPTNWTQFTTGPVLPPAGAVTGRALFGYCPGGDDWGPIGDQTTSGFVYFDDMQTFTNDTHGAGLLQNAGFEVRNCGYLPLTNFPFWEGFGPNGGVVTNHRKSGNLALQIWGLDNLAGQKWSAARSNQYATGAYIFSTNFTTTNAFGIVQLQFLDATGTNVLLTYESARFTAQSPSNAWTYYEASGWAPSGTVYGRTLVGIVGSSSGFGTSTAWFDDSTQRLVSTTGTVAATAASTTARPATPTISRAPATCLHGTGSAAPTAASSTATLPPTACNPYRSPIPTTRWRSHSSPAPAWSIRWKVICTIRPPKSSPARRSACSRWSSPAARRLSRASRARTSPAPRLRTPGCALP